MPRVRPDTRNAGRWLKTLSAAGGALALFFSAAVRPASAVIPRGALIELETLAAGLRSPIGLTHAGDGSGRIFIVDQGGKILIVNGGIVDPTPFLDISSLIPVLNNAFDERGLLGLAFHPNYEQNGRFFIRYSRPRVGVPGEPCVGTSRGCHEEILAEYHVSASDPDLADPASEIILFRVNKPQFNHNAGTVAFGPDGFLYWGFGDGGGAHDGLADVPPSHGPFGNGQNIETALGKLHRIDVDSGSPYAIPPDNPFVGLPGLDEIYAYGLRNPYRFSFDSRPGGTNRLWLADVGQNQFEEIDHVVKGGNYGWVLREGLHCFNPFAPNVPPPTCSSVGALGEPLLDPVAEYSHAEGGISITGGSVYRGPCRQSLLQGKYIFGDFSSAFTTPGGRLYYLIEPTPGAYEIRQFKIGADDRNYGLFLKGFGEDEVGNIYVLGSSVLGPNGTGGVVQKIVFEECLPTPVALSRMTVVREADDALLSWEVSDQIDHAGFLVFRGDDTGARIRLTPAILTGGPRYEYRDLEAPREATEYWLADVSRSGVRTWHGPVSLTPAARPPLALTVAAASPNPFLAGTTVSFALPDAGHVRVRVFDIHGRPVATLLDGTRPGGDQAVRWDGRFEGGAAAPAGFYLLRVEAGGVSHSQKVLLTR